LETRVRSRFRLQHLSTEQFVDVLQEEEEETPLETVQNMYQFIPRRTTAAMKAKCHPAPY
jgi:hypothetical protein